jgi:hypothetical protein
MDNAKPIFLKQEFIPLIQQIPPDRKPAWGLMNLQQMVEHMQAAVDLASGKIKYEGDFVSPDPARMRAFLMSDKPFRENTGNPFLPQEPQPTRNHTLQASIGELQASLLHFFDTFESEPGRKVFSPIFGELDYEGQTRLLHKHALHHLRQFGVAPLQRD